MSLIAHICICRHTQYLFNQYNICHMLHVCNICISVPLSWYIHACHICFLVGINICHTIYAFVTICIWSHIHSLHICRTLVAQSGNILSTYICHIWVIWATISNDISHICNVVLWDICICHRAHILYIYDLSQYWHSSHMHLVTYISPHLGSHSMGIVTLYHVVTYICRHLQLSHIKLSHALSHMQVVTHIVPYIHLSQYAFVTYALWSHIYIYKFVKSYTFVTYIYLSHIFVTYAFVIYINLSHMHLSHMHLSHDT